MNENLRNYIDSLEASGKKMTAEAWAAWIDAECADLEKQGAEVLTDAEKREVLDALENHGFIIVTRAWKVYGADGHRQRESFNPSYKYDFSENGETRIIDIENADKTGTNDYSIIRITRDTYEECKEELEGQLYDGIFENSRTGHIEEI
jgi:hypothetical protein